MEARERSSASASRSACWVRWQGSASRHFGFGVTSDLPDLRALDDYRPALASRVYDRNGALIGEFFDERRQMTPMPEMPKHVVNAFLAAEDDTFFEHGGIDFVSMLRAAWVTLTTDETQGASTITQQTREEPAAHARAHLHAQERKRPCSRAGSSSASTRTRSSGAI